MHMSILALAFLLVVAVPGRVAALTVQIWSGEPPPATGGTQILPTLTTVVNDPENGNKRTVFLNTAPALPSDCAGAPRDFTLSGVTFRFADLTRSGPDATCPNGRILISCVPSGVAPPCLATDTTLKGRNRVYVDNTNPSVPKVVLVGKITALFSGSARTVTVRVTAGAAADFASTTTALTFGAASKGVFKRTGLSTDTTVIAPTNNTVKVTTRANPNNIVNTPSSTAPANSLSTADPPSASIPPSAFQAGAGCTTVLTTKSCSASFDIADTESNITCSSGTCPFVQTDYTYGFSRNADVMEKKSSGITAFSTSLGAVLGALDQCNVWASNPAALGIRVNFLEPSPGNSFSAGRASIAAKAEALFSGGDFFLASPLSAFYVTVPGSVVNDEESVVAVVPGFVTFDANGQKICNPVHLSDLASLQATYAFEGGTDCRFSSYRFEILFDTGQTARGMFGQRSGQFFRNCASTNQSNLNFVTNTQRNWQLDDGPFITFATLRDALPSANITLLQLVLDQGLSDTQNAGFQLVDLDEVSFALVGGAPVEFAPPPAGLEIPVEVLPQAAAVVTHLATGQTLVIQESDINITNSQWVFHVPMSSLFGSGDYEMRMCLAQLCPDDPVPFSVFLPGN